MQLIDILRQKEPPRGAYFLNQPTRYGDLTLDILGPIEAALGQVGMSEEDAATAHRTLAEATALWHGGEVITAEVRLRELAYQFPYFTEGYLTLSEFYADRGNTSEAEYHLKQALALDPSYSNLARLARFLGRTQRYDEARIVGSQLWSERATVSQDDAVAATLDYLVTLSRLQDAGAMIEVSVAAMVEYGNDPRLVYQCILGHVLDGQTEKAKFLLAQAIPRLNPGDEMYPRFRQIRDYLVQHFPAPDQPR